MKGNTMAGAQQKLRHDKTTLGTNGTEQQRKYAYNSSYSLTLTYKSIRE